VRDGNEIGPVVHGDGRAVGQGLEDMTVIGVVVLPFDGENGDLVIFDQGGGDVVLRAEGIRSRRAGCRPRRA